MPINLAEILTLERPLAVLDFETSGLNPDLDRILSMGITIHYSHREAIPWYTLVNPGIPIPPNVHRITNEMVANAPTFADIAPALAPKLVHLDIAGYYVEFDIAFLRAEMKRANVIWEWDGYKVDSLQIYRKLKPHSLQEAYKEYVDKAGFDNPHQADKDVAATEAVLRGQLMKHPNLPRTVKELSEFCFPNKGVVGLDRGGKLTWAGGHAVLTFGKWKNTPLHLVDISYLQWCMTTNFPDDVKAILAEAIVGNFPKQGEPLIPREKLPLEDQPF